MTRVPVDPQKFDLCLVRFQNRDPEAIPEFEIIIKPYLANLARKIGGQLPTDIQEEIVQQACLDLWGKSKAKFDARRANAKKFLVLAVRNAFRQVRADYCPPGQMTRPVKNDRTADRSHVDVISIDELEESSYSRSFEAAEIIRRSEVKSLLRLAPQPVAEAMRRIHCEGDCLTEVAADFDISRFKLSRDIAAYCEQMQVIARFPSVTFHDRILC